MSPPLKGKRRPTLHGEDNQSMVYSKDCIKAGGVSPVVTNPSRTATTAHWRDPNPTLSQKETEEKGIPRTVSEI